MIAQSRIVYPKSKISTRVNGREAGSHTCQTALRKRLGGGFRLGRCRKRSQSVALSPCWSAPGYSSSSLPSIHSFVAIYHTTPQSARQIGLYDEQNMRRAADLTSKERGVMLKGITVDLKCGEDDVAEPQHLAAR